MLQALVADDALGALRGRIQRAFLATGLACALATGLLFAALPPPVSDRLRWAMVLGYLAVGLACAVVLRLGRAAIERATPAVMVMLLAVLGSSSLANGWGLGAPGLAFLSLIACMACAVAAPGPGRAVVVLAAALPLALGAAERFGWLVSHAGPPLLARVTVPLVAVAAGAAAGLALARLLSAHLRDAEAREARFQVLLGIAADAYWEAGPDLRFGGASLRDAQGKFVPIIGPSQESIWRLDAVQMAPEAIEALRRTLQTRQPLRDLPLRWRHADGHWLDMWVSGQPRHDLAGQFLGYWGVARDVTRERQADQALLQSQAWLKALVSTSPDVMTLSELGSGRYVVVNQAFCQFSGWTAEEAVGRTAMELGNWADAGERDKLIQALANTSQMAEMSLRFRTRSGEVKALMVLASRFSQDGQQYLVMNSRDIGHSQRERQERDAILANASVGIAFIRQGRFAMTNPRFDDIYGWPHGELVGREVHVVWPTPAQAQAYGEEVAPGLRRGEAIHSERWTTRRDATPFLVNLRAKAIDLHHPGQSGTIWIAEDVTTQRQAEAELARARDAAEAANQAKSGFLANTSHELRTPLNAVQGLVRMARQPGLDDARRQQYLGQIDDSAQTLGLIISDILDLSKIEAGKLDLETVAFNLPELLESLGHVHAALADSRGLTFRVEIDGRLPTTVRGDALRLRQILSNFLHNAQKFTEHGGIVLRALAGAGVTVRFEVQDTGPGIEATTQARLFTPFTQADESTTRRFGGSGLGLAICRQLAVRMGGSVGVDSLPERGSCFYAELPLSPASDTEVGALLAAPDSDALHGARVLLVEDNPVNMMIAVALLESWQMDVTQAVDGYAALAAVTQAQLAQRPFALVLMDVQMPGISGYEATRRLRQQYSSTELPVIALTAAAMVSERAQALEAGMNDFLTKPLDTQRMRMVLSRTVEAGRPS